jgi:(p)ppGpp synthase/HD superfamily hydrolase
MIGCDTLTKFNDTPELWIDVEWEREGPKRVSGRLKTVLSNVPGSLAALTTVIGQQGGNISNIHLIDRTPDFFSFQLELDVKNVEHLRSIIGVLQSNKHIESVERDING